VKSFNNSDPQHAKINRLRARKDKPHIWFQDGFWRVSPKPIKRRQVTAMTSTLWARAHNAVHIANRALQWDRAHGAKYVRWEVAGSAMAPGEPAFLLREKLT
jgi:hypothetical protein